MEEEKETHCFHTANFFLSDSKQLKTSFSNILFDFLISSLPFSIGVRQLLNISYEIRKFIHKSSNATVSTWS